VRLTGLLDLAELTEQAAEVDLYHRHDLRVAGLEAASNNSRAASISPS
jgi:hypothetical protein